VSDDLLDLLGDLKKAIVATKTLLEAQSATLTAIEDEFHHLKDDLKAAEQYAREKDEAVTNLHLELEDLRGAHHEG
jgi:cell division protein FtsB